MNGIEARYFKVITTTLIMKEVEKVFCHTGQNSQQFLRHEFENNQLVEVIDPEVNNLEKFQGPC